jgi:SAM-dependent methyltransferase
VSSSAVVFKRLSNGIRRIAARLPPAEEAVWPGVRNDLFVAHESVYHFATRFAVGRRVLDAACGTGYGSHILASAGATDVLGLDLNPRRIRYAARSFRAPNLRYCVGDCNVLRLPRPGVDFIVSSNTLEHLAHPTRFLSAAAEALAIGGHLLAVVPPVLSEHDVAVHATNSYHESALSLRAWADLFAASGWSHRFFSHRCRTLLDLSSPAASRVTAIDFEFVEQSVESAYSEPPLSAVYLLSRDV